MDELLKQINLLYVEDDENIRDLLQKVLNRKVKNLYIACDGAEGLEKYYKYKPDIILTDIKMPKMDGITMSKKIRELDSSVPIIVLSAHSELNYFLDAIDINVSGFLMKPLDREKLFNSIVENAKIVLYEKEKKEQDLLLQEVVNLQPSIIFSADDKKETLFMNKLFVEYFTNTSAISALSNSEVYTYLKDNNSVTIIDENKDVFWIDYIFSNPNKNFKIFVEKDNKVLEFNVKTRLVKYGKKEQVVIVINLFEL